MRRHGKPTVAVYDLSSGRWKQIVESSIQAMVSDDSGSLYIGLRNGRILQCTFSDCPHSFETNVLISALASARWMGCSTSPRTRLRSRVFMSTIRARRAA